MIPKLFSTNIFLSQIPTFGRLFPVCLAVFIAADDQTVIATIFPSIMKDFQLNISDIDNASWTITGYLLGYICMMPVVGKLSDIFGNKRLLTIILIVFAITSMLVGFSTNLSFLVASRILQAIAAGATIPLAISIANTSLPKNQHLIAYGIIGASAEIGAIVGPLWGGLIINILDWRWVFWLNIPLTFIIIPIIYRSVKIHRKKNGVVDLSGALFLTLTLIFLTLFISRLQNLNLTTLMCGLFAISAAITFIFRQIISNHPIIPRNLFSREFILAHMIQFLVGIALIIGMVTIPLMANTIFELSPLHSGLWLLRMTLGVAIGALLGSISGKLFSNRTLIIAGLLLSATAYWLLSNWHQNISEPLLTINLFLTGTGLGILIGPIIQTATYQAGDNNQGISASLISTTKFLGMALGISSISAWGAYRFQKLNSDFTLSFLTSNPTSVNQLLTNGMTVLTEFFLIAMTICLIAAILAFLLRRN